MNFLKAIMIRKLTKETTLKIKIKISKGFKIRVKVACLLIIIAGMVLGCNMDIEEVESKGLDVRY